MNREIKFREVEAYSWECPECGCFNTHDKYCDAICKECSYENDEDLSSTEIEAYSWECPDCGCFNVHDKYSDAICDECSIKININNN